MICDICGKGRQFGHNVSFSQRKTNRDFKPNLQTKRLQTDSGRVKLKVCTQCLRKLKSEEQRLATTSDKHETNRDKISKPQPA